MCRKGNRRADDRGSTSPGSWSRRYTRRGVKARYWGPHGKSPNIILDRSDLGLMAAAVSLLLACSQNGPEHHPTTRAGAIYSFRDRKAVGIVFKPNRDCPKALAMSRSNGLPLSTTLFELRSRQVCGDRAPGVAIPTLAKTPICDCALLLLLGQTKSARKKMQVVPPLYAVAAQVKSAWGIWSSRSCTGGGREERYCPVRPCTFRLTARALS